MKKFLVLSILCFSGLSAAECIEHIRPAVIGFLSAYAGYQMGEKLIKATHGAHIAYNIVYIAKKISKMPKEMFNKIMPGRHNDENISDLSSDCGDAVHSINHSINDITHHNNAWVSYVCGILGGAIGWYFSSRPHHAA